MADVPIAGAPTEITANHHPDARGRMPPLVGHCHRPSESLLLAGIRLGLLLCCDADFHLLIDIGLHLLRTRWLLNYKGSFLLGRWSSCGRKDLEVREAILA
jgi:hypothetical protein